MSADDGRRSVPESVNRSAPADSDNRSPLVETVEAVAEACTLAGVGRPDTVVDHEHGYGHRSWVVGLHGTQALVKACTRRDKNADLANELGGNALLRSAGVRVPEILGWLEAPNPIGRPLLIQEWIPGIDASESLQACRHQPAESESIVADVLSLVRQIHAVPAPRFADHVSDEGWPYDSWPQFLSVRGDVLQTQAASVLDRKVLQRFKARFAAELELVPESIEPRYTHGDLHFANFIVSEKGPVVTDFEHSRYYDPLWDYVKLDLFDIRPDSTSADAIGASVAETLQSGVYGKSWRRLTIYYALELLYGFIYFALHYSNDGMAPFYGERLEQWTRLGLSSSPYWSCESS